MTKTEIKNSENHVIISALIHTYTQTCFRYNAGNSSKQLDKQILDMSDELIKRGLFTEEEKERLFK